MKGLFVGLLALALFCAVCLAAPPDAKGCPPVGVSSFSSVYSQPSFVQFAHQRSVPFDFGQPAYVDPFFAQDFRQQEIILAGHGRFRPSGRGGQTIIFVDRFGRVRRIRT